MAGIQPEGPVRGAPTDPSVPDSARSGAEPGVGGSAGTGTAAGIGRGSWRRGQRPGQPTVDRPAGAQPAGEGVVTNVGDQGVAAGPDGRPAGARGWVLTNSTGVLVAVSLLLVGLVAAVASTISWQVNASS
ncbi:MAG: hypothetical protein QOF98_2677, partial [Streptomyces sp.]|nr:hypothetical protein [Streptomyces sp.]